MTRQYKLSVIVMITTLLSGQYVAVAASVYPEKGAIFVNSGNGFVKIDGDTYVSPGARVMAKPGGAAVISYSPGCSVNVGPGEVKTVQDSIPCNTGADEGPSTTTMLIAGGAVAAAVGVGLAVSQGDDKPASP